MERSAKADRFCELVARGNVTQAEAYRQAGYAVNGTQKTTRERAHALSKRHKEHIDELRQEYLEELRRAAAWSKEEALVALKKVLSDCVDEEGHVLEKKSYISACAELNKVCGHYAPEKHVVGGNLNMADATIDDIMENLGYEKK